MGEISIPKDEQETLHAIDVEALEGAIETCLAARRLGSMLKTYRLDRAGPFVAAKFRAFEVALAEHAGAKASKKVADTYRRARAAGSALSNAVQLMKHRISKQVQESELFFVDDHVIPPSHFSELLDVCVSYRWRPGIDADWVHDSITFSHVHEPRPEYTAAPAKRKPSASQQVRDRQDELWRVWEQLMRLALYSLIQYFREGRDGAEIPKAFQARPDAFHRRLNNFSCNFWMGPAKTKN